MRIYLILNADLLDFGLKGVRAFAGEVVEEDEAELGHGP
jgi:hypothetical protein